MICVLAPSQHVVDIGVGVAEATVFINLAEVRSKQHRKNASEPLLRRALALTKEGIESVSNSMQKSSRGGGQDQIAQMEEHLALLRTQDDLATIRLATLL
jgi:hypothetical protein